MENKQTMEERFNNQVASTNIFDLEGNDITEETFNFIRQEIAVAQAQAREKILKDLIKKSKLISCATIDCGQDVYGIYEDDIREYAKSHSILLD